MRRVARVVGHRASGRPARVISTVDPQARHTRKSRSNRKDGYRGHLATEPDTGLITDCEMTMTTGEANTDAAVGVKMANRDRFHNADGDTADASDGDVVVSTESAVSTDVDTEDIEYTGTAVSTADFGAEDADTADGLEIYGD